MSYLFGHHKEAARRFDICFKELQSYTYRTHRILFSTVPISNKDNLKTIYPFLFYAMFLFHVKSDKGCKYFEYCLTFRPVN